MMAHLTAEQERIVELALDNVDRMRFEDYNATSYAIDQLTYGGSPAYHEGGARPQRSSTGAQGGDDVNILIEAIKGRLRKYVDVAQPVTVAAPRVWGV